MEHSFRIGIDNIEINIQRLGNDIDVYIRRDFNEHDPNDPMHYPFTSVNDCLAFLSTELVNASIHSSFGEQHLFATILLEACLVFLKGALV